MRHQVPDLTFVGSAFAVIAGWQEQLDWSFRFIALLLGMIAGGLSIAIRLHDLNERRKARKRR